MSFWRRSPGEQPGRLGRRRRRSKAYDRGGGPTAIGAAAFRDPPATSSAPAQPPRPPGAGSGPAAAGVDLRPGELDGPRPGAVVKRQAVELRLMHAEDMFELTQTDLFSEYRNFLTGIDFCIGELRARASRRPVRLEIHLPQAEVDDQTTERIARTLRRYCKHRMRFNRRETRALRLSGIGALRVGLPVAALGFVLVGVATSIKPSGGAAHLIVDHLGWVLLWLGVWFPLDEFLFYPLAYGREDQVLRLLYDAEVVIMPYQEVLAAPAPAGPI